MTLGAVARAGVEEQRRQLAGPRPRPWAVAVASVRAPREGKTTDKRRPVILLFEHRIGWAVIGLTTRQTYNSGVARPQVAHPETMHLSPSWLWSPRPAYIGYEDIYAVIGDTHPEDRARIAEWVQDPSGRMPDA